MRRVTGLGGVFFKCANPDATARWYKKHLGIDAGAYGAIFRWRTDSRAAIRRQTLWTPFPANTKSFLPGKDRFMLNYIVDDLNSLLRMLRKEKVKMVGEMQEYAYGKFAWIVDPEGRKVELWEPPAPKRKLRRNC